MVLQDSEITSDVIKFKCIMNHLKNGEEELDEINKERFSQIYTSESIANYMASMFKESNKQVIKVLDPGSGMGILTAAFLLKILQQQNSKIKNIVITLYEIDKIVIPRLEYNMKEIKEFFSKRGIKIDYKIYNENFIYDFYNKRNTSQSEVYDFVIMNPPYKKLKSNSEDKLMLRKLKINVTNYYSAFLSLAKRLLVDNGELVAITPRSFCNGAYFLWFRKDFIKDMVFDKIHLFESKNDVFKSDDILQENIIYHCIKKKPKKNDKVKILYSYDDSLEEIIIKERKFEDVVFPNDEKQLIRILKHNEESKITKKINYLPCTLTDLGISVSCGPIVDFRERKGLLKKIYKEGCVPLFFGEHISVDGIKWPKKCVKKYNYIVYDDSNVKRMRTKGNYVLVKRMSSKEERRRINSAVCYEDNYNYDYFGFDNKVNYYHIDKKGLPLIIAKGLSIYLNSSIVDIYFRTFSGSTQVNVSDLKSLKYPSEAQLKMLGKEYDRIISERKLGDQYLIDKAVNYILFNQE